MEYFRNISIYRLYVFFKTIAKMFIDLWLDLLRGLCKYHRNVTPLVFVQSHSYAKILPTFDSSLSTMNELLPSSFIATNG